MGTSNKITEMAKSEAFTGEPELLTLVHIVKRPIVVQYEDVARQTLFGEAYLKDSADTVNLLNYPDSKNLPGHYDLLVTEEKQEGQPKDLPKADIYVIIGAGKQQWYPDLILNVDTDANDVEVKFMYPSAKKHNEFSFGNTGLVWCTSEIIIPVCKAPTCNNKEVNSFLK